MDTGFTSGFVANDDERVHQLECQRLCQGGFPIAWRASEQDAVSGAQIVGVQQLCPMLLLHQFLYLHPDFFWQYQAFQVALRRDLVEQVFVRAVAHGLANRRACSLKGTGLRRKCKPLRAQWRLKCGFLTAL